MFNAILIKLAKYFFLSFFLCLFFYAALLGREGIEKYHLGEPGSMLEEYIAVIVSWIIVDIVYAIYKRIRKSNRPIKE